MVKVINPILAGIGLVLLLLFATSITIVLAQTWIAGVSKGDVFYYEMYARYVSSNPHAQIKVPEFEANNTAWIRIEISDVNGTKISQIYTLHFKNNSEQIIIGQTDLIKSTWGSGPADFRGVPICPADLNEESPIPSVPFSINETIIRTYLGDRREINHIIWTTPEENGECYFDRKTGMLVELTREHIFANTYTDDTVNKTDIIKLTSSNAWTPEFPIFSAFVLLMVGVILVALLWRQKMLCRLIRSEL